MDIEHDFSQPLEQGTRPARDLLAGSLILCAALTVAGCGARDEGSGASGDSLLPVITDVSNPGYRQPPLSCQLDDMKGWVHASMLDYYLFADQVDSDADLDSHEDVESLITALRVAPYDTFSYITDEQSHSSRFDDGETVGLGWLLHVDANDEMWFKLVDSGSPLAEAGVERGERLVTVNDRPAIDFFRQSSTDRDELLSSEDNGASARLTVASVLGTSRNLVVSKAAYSLQSVLDQQTVEHNGLDVAYLHFHQFLDTASAELQSAFSSLATQDIDELVLDMRYNAGGRVAVSAELASYLVGRQHAGDTFVSYQANQKYRDEHSSSFVFENLDQALDLNRVFVLQTDDTCSAAELVINGLRPYMEVITIGGTSCGKPYASIPNTACDKVMNALELEALNAEGVGAYYNGIAADCPASDLLSQRLGNPAENLFATALDYIDTGFCSSNRRLFESAVEQPDWLRPAWYGSSELQATDR